MRSTGVVGSFTWPARNRSCPPETGTPDAANEFEVPVYHAKAIRTPQRDISTVLPLRPQRLGAPPTLPPYVSKLGNASPRAGAGAFSFCHSAISRFAAGAGAGAPRALGPSEHPAGTPPPWVGVPPPPSASGEWLRRRGARAIPSPGAPGGSARRGRRRRRGGPAARSRVRGETARPPGKECEVRGAASRDPRRSPWASPEADQGRLPTPVSRHPSSRAGGRLPPSKPPTREWARMRRRR